MQDIILIAIYEVSKAVLYADALLLLAIVGFGVATGVKVVLDKRLELW